MTRRLARPGLALLALIVLPAPAAPPEPDPTIGRSYQIPYRLTNTNHYLVRVRINGKGPFHFLVDSGAPALYVGTAAAKAIGLKPSEDDFWTPVDRLDLEGGAVLKDVKARVEDPFQLTGMNALGLPGTTIDGILGFTILARFKLEFDPTRDRMTWTRIAYQPRDPFIPKLPKGVKPPVPPEVQAMQMLGPMMKVAAVIVGKQPEDVIHPRGFLGVELAEPQAGDVRIAAVWPDTPAARAGLKAGDRLVNVLGHEIKGLESAHATVAGMRQDAEVKMEVRRGEEMMEVTLTAGEGF
jgi:hypothetical protein